MDRCELGRLKGGAMTSPGELLTPPAAEQDEGTEGIQRSGNVKGLGIAAVCVMAWMSILDANGSAADGSDARTDTDLALRRVPEKWKDAYNARDAAGVAALYAADGYYVSAHVIAHGRPDIQAYFQRGIDAGGHIDSIQILASGHAGDLAYTVGTYEATNAGQKVRGRNVVVLRKVGEEWLMVAHETVVADQP